LGPLEEPPFGPLETLDRGNERAVCQRANTASVKNGRSFAAFIGLVPNQSSSDGEECLGKISKRRDHYLRSLRVVGGLAVIESAKRHAPPWAAKAVAAANNEDRRSCAGRQDGADGDETRGRVSRPDASSRIE